MLCTSSFSVIPLNRSKGFSNHGTVGTERSCFSYNKWLSNFSLNKQKLAKCPGRAHESTCQSLRWGPTNTNPIRSKWLHSNPLPCSNHFFLLISHLQQWTPLHSKPLPYINILHTILVPTFPRPFPQQAHVNNAFHLLLKHTKKDVKRWIMPKTGFFKLLKFYYPSLQSDQSFCLYVNGSDSKLRLVFLAQRVGNWQERPNVHISCMQHNFSPWLNMKIFEINCIPLWLCQSLSIYIHIFKYSHIYWKSLFV